MSDGLAIKNSLTIPAHELHIETTKAGGPGGQHVNKTESCVIVRWNIPASAAFDEEQKAQLLAYFHSRLTSEGDLIIRCASERSQYQNKEEALQRLSNEIRKALHVRKKRQATRMPKAVKEKNIQHKKKRALIKKFRSKMIHED